MSIQKFPKTIYTITANFRVPAQNISAFRTDFKSMQDRFKGQFWQPFCDLDWSDHKVTSRGIFQYFRIGINITCPDVESCDRIEIELTAMGVRYSIPE